MIPFLAVLPLLFWDFSADSGGLVTTGSPGQWQWAATTAGPADGVPAWATNPGGFYLNDADSQLVLPPVDLSGTTEPVLVFRHWYDVRGGDAATIEIDAGGGWFTVTPTFGYPAPAGFVGTSNGWVTSYVNLDPYGNSPRIRLRFSSDVVLADDGWYIGEAGIYDGDATPPRLTPILVPPDVQDLVGPYPVRVEAVDDRKLTGVSLHWSASQGGQGVIDMIELGGDLWHGGIPAQTAGNVVSWYVTADDGTQQSRWPVNVDATFRIFLAAPTSLQGPEGRFVGTEVPLGWAPPVSPHPVLAYRIVEAGFEDQPVDVGITSASVPLRADGSWEWRVIARYDAGFGDPSAPLILDPEVPELLSVEPEAAWQGDRVYVDLIGSGLYLQQGATTLDLGEGISVDEIAVIDANHAVAVVAVDGDAASGTRTATLQGPHGALSFADVFTVSDGAARPQVVSVSPRAVTQGQTVEIEVQVSEPFAGPVSVEPGAGLLVVSDVEVDGDTAVFEILVRGTASPGERAVVLDDGARLWAMELTIREYVAPPARDCSSSASPPRLAGLLLGLLGLLTLRRRTTEPGSTS